MTLRNFPTSARRKAGLELQALQRGETPTDCKPMPSIGPGVMEIRINVGNAYRIFYMAKFAEGIYVLHAFQKKNATHIEARYSTWPATIPDAAKT